ncbi:MAG: hypothetical protein K9M11_01595 [Candidatus Pacebacteria bacterium]|nr:hypothetical protein [Candidatus Paceibacterota bacterium]
MKNASASLGQNGSIGSISPHMVAQPKSISSTEAKHQMAKEEAMRVNLKRKNMLPIPGPGCGGHCTL